MNDFRAFGRDISVAVIGRVLTAIVLAIAGVVWAWHEAIWEAITDVWAWFGRPTATPHWLLVLLIALAVAGVLAVANQRLAARAAARSVGEDQPPITEAQAFRDAYDRFMSEFAGWRDELVLRKMGGNDAWLAEHRALRRDALDTMQPILPALRHWLRHIDEHWTTPLRDEPVWTDIEGPDESIESVIDKFLMPVTLAEALDFWDGWEPAKFRQLSADRIDLVDSFVRSLRRKPDPQDVIFVAPSWRTRLRRWWRRRQRAKKAGR
jgi:hypothetical protein